MNLLRKIELASVVTDPTAFQSPGRWWCRGGLCFGAAAGVLVRADHLTNEQEVLEEWSQHVTAGPHRERRDIFNLLLIHPKHTA